MKKFQEVQIGDLYRYIGHTASVFDSLPELERTYLEDDWDSLSILPTRLPFESVVVITDKSQFSIHNRNVYFIKIIDNKTHVCGWVPFHSFYWNKIL